MIPEILIQKLAGLKDQFNKKVVKLEMDLADPHKKTKLKETTKQKMRGKIQELKRASGDLEDLLNRLDILNF